jgi:hypothetical protein
MKTCSQYREHLAGQAAGLLEQSASEPLRAHLRACAGCRQYAAEMTRVGAGLSQSAIDLPPVDGAEAFHQRLVARIARESAGSARASQPTDRFHSREPFPWFRRCSLVWRWAGAVMLLALFALVYWRFSSPPPPLRVEKAAGITQPKEAAVRLAPTPSLWAYQLAAGQSWEDFQKMLARHAAQPSSPEINVTAFTRNAAGLTD